MTDAKGKGKGKIPATDDQAQDQVSESPSLLSRVTASASGLARNAFTAPIPNELNEQVAAALSNNGKGQAFTNNGSGSTSWAESPKSASSSLRANRTSTLQSGHAEEHQIQAENEFSGFLDGIDSFVPTSQSALADQTGEFNDNELGKAWARAQGAPIHLHPGITVAEQENRDGQGVLDLLSGPLAMDEAFEQPPDDDENYDWGLSEEQLATLRAIAPEPRSYISPNSPLNLVPSFENLSVEEKLAWREQWEGVLTRYADEVWGGMLPLVKEARREIEEMEREPEVREQPKALRRLGAILAHLQNR